MNNNEQALPTIVLILFFSARRGNWSVDIRKSVSEFYLKQILYILCSIDSMFFAFTVHVVLVIFIYLVYTASSELGSPGIVYRRLLEVSSRSRICQDPISHSDQSCGPVSGNYKGSYLTMLSSGGLIFGIINIVGNFGTVFVDNVSSAIETAFLTSNLNFEIGCPMSIDNDTI